ncbi:prepilin-type N-terminal cleavage/methylation domain-containing protein, partial [bacterium]|nr:prepilin-type N-terminal cleavage/methylation domain-containing protein [bacterium]
MNKKGFTLIEVLASIVIIAVALIPIMLISLQTLDSSFKGENLTKVIFLAQG